MTSSEADHVLLTRFNLPTEGIEGLIRAREGWLNDRVELFETFTVPSVARQTSRPTWLVYFDPESPQWLLDRIRPHCDQGIFTPVFRVTVDTNDLRTDLRTHVRRHHDRLLTTNLDNDDAIAVDFCERLRSTPAAALPSVLYWPSGLIRNGSSLFLHTDRRNAFCSVIESWDKPVTAWSEYHNEFPRTMSVIEVKGPPGWLQVVHGANVSNRVRGRLVTPSLYAHRFGESAASDLRTPSRPEVWKDALVGSPLRRVRDGARSAVRVVGLSVLGKDRYQAAKATLARLRGAL